MSGQAIAAIIAFAAGIIVAVLGGWFNQRIERRKHVAQLASMAFVDGVTAIAENLQCADVLSTPGDHLSEDEKDHWRRRAFETTFTFNSAKARIAAYGNSEANGLLARIERQGGVRGNDPGSRQMAAKLVLSFRKEVGFKKNDISERDIASVLFGPTPDERQGQFVGWPRPPQPPISGEESRVLEEGRTKPGVTVTAADEIKKLAELHTVGILTDDEFAAKKKQLLGL